MALGFQPVRRRGTDGTLTYELANCPYRDVVREDQPAVCGLHRGLTRGLLDVMSRKTALAGFVQGIPTSPAV